MAKRDEFLFGAAPFAAPDSDRDGVSDAQERLDGTDPTDASSVKHVDPAMDASLVGSDPRGDLGPAEIGHVTVVDVMGAAPAGFTADQALPTGLDGKPIESGPNHYGVNDSLLAGHAGTGVDVSRDPLLTGHAAASDATSTSPESEMATGSADPGNNRDLVAAGAAETASGLDGGAVTAGAATAAASAASTPAPAPTTVDIPDLSSLMKMTDPDTGGGATLAPTAEQFAHAVATQGGGVTDTVHGIDRQQIDDTAPPASKGDLVTDPVEPQGSTDVVTSTAAAPPGIEISHTINPADGFGVVRGPTTAGGGAGDGYATSSSAATAADASPDSPGDAGSVTVVGDESGGGIQTVADDSAGSDVGAAVDDAPASLEPMVDATAPVDDVSFQPSTDSFSGLDLPDDLAVPDQVDLDDGF
jgi:hypothetical protein